MWRFDIMKLNKRLKKMRSAALKQLDNVTLDGVLGAFGLQQIKGSKKRSTGALASFGIGVVVGAGLGLAFAPTTGVKFREHILHLVGMNGKDSAKEVGIEEGQDATGGGSTAIERSATNNNPRARRTGEASPAVP